MVLGILRELSQQPNTLRGLISEQDIESSRELKRLSRDRASLAVRLGQLDTEMYRLLRIFRDEENFPQALKEEFIRIDGKREELRSATSDLDSLIHETESLCVNVDDISCTLQELGRAVVDGSLMEQKGLMQRLVKRVTVNPWEPDDAGDRGEKDATQKGKIRTKLTLTVDIQIAAQMPKSPAESGDSAGLGVESVNQSYDSSDQKSAGSPHPNQGRFFWTLSFSVNLYEFSDESSSRDGSSSVSRRIPSSIETSQQRALRFQHPLESEGSFNGYLHQDCGPR